MIFEHLVQVLADLAPPLLGHGRNRHAQQLAVRNGVEAQIGGAHRLFNLLQDGGVPGCNQNQLRLGRRNLRQLADGGLRAVVVHLDLVEHMHAGPAGARRGQVGLEGGHGLVHPPPEAGIEFLERRNSGHNRDCHRFPSLHSKHYSSEFRLRQQNPQRMRRLAAKRGLAAGFSRLAADFSCYAESAT